MACFLDVQGVRRLVARIGIDRLLRELADRIETEFRQWEQFEKVPRLASHSPGGVIELMPVSDHRRYAFKYVNGHPGNTRLGLQTVAAFGVLADVATGYPVVLSEMTIATALRTGAMSALAARYLARPDAQTMAMIGCGAQSEFQALAFRAVLGIDRLRIYDTDPAASAKFRRNLGRAGFRIETAASAAEAALGADIISTVTADKQRATILSDNMVGSGVHINAVGGDCPGKTELHRAILERASVFVEYEPQTRIEGEIQQMPADFAVTELWQVMTGAAPGRTSRHEVTVFDSVGFALEDLVVLDYLHERAREAGLLQTLELIAEPGDPRDLFGLVCEPVAALAA